MKKKLESVSFGMEEGKSKAWNTTQEEPRDYYGLAYLIHFILGASNLLPWNALITAVDYFGHLYPEKHVNRVFSVAYMSSSLPVLALLVCCGDWMRSIGLKLRINLGLSLFVVSLILVPLLDWVHLTGSKRDGAYGITLAAVVVCGLADGLVGGSLIGSVGKLPKRYMQAVFAGTATSGVLLSFLRILTKASLPQNEHGLRTSAHLYFIVAILIVSVCMVFFNILDKLPVMQQYTHNKNLVSTAVFSKVHACTDELKMKPKLWAVVKQIKWPAFAVVIIYTVTLSIFPGFITEDVKSKLLGDWYPLLLITAYNIFDLVGKCLTAAYVPSSITRVAWSCAARLLFYPLYAASLHGPHFFRSEAPVMVLTSGLGVTNGYLTSALMILAPKSVASDEAESAGVVMALFLGIGLIAGSVLGWFWII